MPSLFRVAAVVLIVATACTSSAHDDCGEVYNLNAVANPKTDRDCEVMLTNRSQSMRVTIPAAAATCSSTICDVACTSPDVPVSFAACYRGRTDGTLGFALSPESKVKVQEWLGGKPGDQASATITCGGAVVWYGTMGLCTIPL